MKSIRLYVYFFAAFVLVSVAPRANAQWAVIDVNAIVQLVQQVETLDQTLTVARNELTQAQQEYQAMTGTRGMQNLLSGTNRNYLPSNTAQLTSSLSQLSAGYSQLSSSIQAAVGANAVLTPQQVAALAPDQQARLAAWRTLAATLQGITGSSVANASGRFAAIQGLINAIGAAPDQKSVLDLQARIAAENGMLQNEQTKLQGLYQWAQAQELVNQQQDRETAIADYGQFATRLRPAP